MQEREIKVKKNVDPSLMALLVQKASEYSSHISMVLGEKTANAKSIMGLISLGITEGQSVKILAKGDDANEAVKAFDNLL